MTFKRVRNEYKHFIIRLIDPDCPTLKSLKVQDAFMQGNSIFIKDKKAVRDLIAQLMVHMEDLDDEDQS